MSSSGEGWRLDLGAGIVRAGGVFFRVWAPWANTVSAIILPGGEREIRLEREDTGYFSGSAEGGSDGDRYVYRVDDRGLYPDPASRYQPDGVYGPSQVIDPDEFPWNDVGWRGAALQDFVIYELHTGTFTREGTFEAIIPHLGYLCDLGITALELMPIAQFPGGRNWGYDGVYPFAPQNTYGGPNGLKKLISEAHRNGLSVILDVVYNHLGPEGNYLPRYGPYFTDRYRTPWGDAVNFDGPFSDAVRHFFISNALYWISEYHIDALRIDAVHGIFDFSARHFLEELKEAVRSQTEAAGRNAYVIAESDLNDVRVINPVENGGCGLDAQWNDDFHHALHAVITGERTGYYEDFGTMEQLAKAFKEGFVYSGQYSRFRKRKHGSSSKDRPASQFVVFSQSHDQVGNRMSGDRLSLTQPMEKLKLAAGTVILSPYIPLLFMGEEYGETAPFLYFTSHSDDGLARAVTEGRRLEFASFGWQGDMPAPQAEVTFLDSKLSPGLHQQGRHRALFLFHRELMRLRREIPALRNLDKENMEVTCHEEKRVLCVRRWTGDDETFCLFNFGEDVLSQSFALPAGTWDKLFESSATEWGGDGGLAGERIESHDTATEFSLSPYSLALYRRSGKGG